jgi:hypothetical protein
MEEISWCLNSGKATDLEFARRPEENRQIPQSSFSVSQPRFEMAPLNYKSVAL